MLRAVPETPVSETPVSETLVSETPVSETPASSSPAGADKPVFAAVPNAEAVTAPPSSRPPFRPLLQRVAPETRRAWALATLSVVGGLWFWWWAAEVNLDLYVDFQNVPSPLVVLAAFLGHLGDEDFYIHIAVSLRRIAISYGLATVLGVLIGMAMGRSPAIRAMVTPYIEIVRPIPAVAWIPLAILMWPTEEASIIYITFLGALFPIVLNTLHGVEQTPEVLVRAARSLGASRLAIFRFVVLPAALPSISAGLAIGMGVSWFSLLAGEIISGQYGIGYFTWNAYSLIEYPDIVVGMLVIGGLGTLSTWGVRRATAPLLAWQKRTR
jgi:NitT/TauT family transport system permease protein